MRAPMPASPIAIRSSMRGMASRVRIDAHAGHFRQGTGARSRALPRRMRRAGSCSPAPAETRRRSLRFTRAIALNPNSHEGHYFYARHLFARGDFEGAIEHYGRAAEIQPDDYRSPLLSVTAARSLGRHDQAAKLGKMGIERAEHALKLHPESADPAQLGATTLASLGQHERAREWIGRALATDSDDANALYNCACACAQLGDIDRAIDLLERVLPRFHGNEDRMWFKQRFRPRSDPQPSALPKTPGDDGIVMADTQTTTQDARAPEPLELGHGKVELEVFLEPTCPFSKRAFGKLQPLLDAVGEDQLTVKIRFVSQPWHLFSGIVTRTILAATATPGGKQAGFAAMNAVYDNREEFEFEDHCSGPNMDRTPAQIIAHLSEPHRHRSLRGVQAEERRPGAPVAHAILPPERRARLAHLCRERPGQQRHEQRPEHRGVGEGAGPARRSLRARGPDSCQGLTCAFGALHKLFGELRCRCLDSPDCGPVC